VENPPADKPSDAIVLDARSSRAYRIAIDPMQTVMQRSCQFAALRYFRCEQAVVAGILPPAHLERCRYIELGVLKLSVS
jgi:hypothetical protein